MRTETTIEIAAPPARVWAVTVALEAWPTWTPTVSSIEVLDEGPLRVGTRARLAQPGYRPAVWTVTRLYVGREFAWETRSLGMRVSAVHRIEASGGGTRVGLEVTTSGPTDFLFGALVRRVSRRFLPQEAAGLKRVCEEGAGVSAQA